MRAVVQRVTGAQVVVDGEQIAKIGKGFLVLVAVMEGDTEQDAVYLSKKLCGLRVFEDENGKMNRSIQDTGGSMLIVSQFTLAGDARHGNRPGFSASAAPETAQVLYLRLADLVRAQGIGVQTGRFGADMQVSLVNDGPVTILLDSSRRF